jgi:hypothetical protein
VRPLSLLVLAALVVVPAGARADDGDGAYGRLDADVMLSLGVGGGVSVGGATEGVALAEVRARYLDMVGLVIAPEWRPEGDARVALAVDVRPLFPLRFFLNQESGSEWLDLLVDSIGVELGASVLTRSSGTGVGLTVGFGIDVPLLVPSLFADGLFLHLGARHVHASPTDQASPEGGASDWLFHAVLTLKLGVGAGLATPEAPRWTR